MFENLGFFEIPVLDRCLKCFKSLRFLKSKFSIFSIGEYQKHGFIKVGEIKSAISAISEKSAFSTWPFADSLFGKI